MVIIYMNKNTIEAFLNLAELLSARNWIQQFQQQVHPEVLPTMYLLF